MRGVPVLAVCFGLGLTLYLAPARAVTSVPAHPVLPPAHAPGGTFRFVAYGDCRGSHTVHPKLVGLIMSYNPELVIQTGDLVARGSDAQQWKTYDAIVAPLRKQCLIYPARGNHDQGGPGYEAEVTAPFTSGNKLYYSFDHGGCHFIALDNFSPFAPGTAQYKWLKDDLHKAQGTAGHIFVYFHEPPYSIGLHGSNYEVRKTFCPLFKEADVRAVFCGHDHNYYRTTRDGTVYVVTGGGGAPLYPCDPNKGTIPGDKFESVNHFLVCDVRGSSMTVTAIRLDGTLLDQFVASAK